jgi:hypothetical protein
LAFFGLEFFYGAGFRGFDFVLHFHGFDDEEALAGFDFVAGFDEETDDFAGHGGGDFLAAFGFDGAVFAAAPGARVGDFGFEFVRAVLNGERAVGIWGDADFVRLAVEQDGEDAGGDFDGVGVGWCAVESDLPAIGVAVRVFPEMRISYFMGCDPIGRGGLRVSSGSLAEPPEFRS